MSESVKNISVGLLAYGAIGDEHSRAIRAVDGLRLTAVADTNPGSYLPGSITGT